MILSLKKLSQPSSTVKAIVIQININDDKNQKHYL